MTFRTLRISTSGMSRAAVVRGRLKHSWLENEILNKTPEVVVVLRHSAGWPALHHFSNEAKQAVALADEIESGFSPARLVDECAPLAALAEDQRNALRTAAHEAYLACFDVRGAADRLSEAAKNMQVSLTGLLVEWDKGDDAVSDEELLARWQSVLDKAELLRDALDALPRGIVLP